jgi:hypothetical protein
LVGDAGSAKQNFGLQFEAFDHPDVVFAQAEFW